MTTLSPSASTSSMAICISGKAAESHVTAAFRLSGPRAATPGGASWLIASAATSSSASARSRLLNTSSQTRRAIALLASSDMFVSSDAVGDGLHDAPLGFTATGTSVTASLTFHRQPSEKRRYHGAPQV